MLEGDLPTVNEPTAPPLPARRRRGRDGSGGGGPGALHRVQQDVDHRPGEEAAGAEEHHAQPQPDAALPADARAGGRDRIAVDPGPVGPQVPESEGQRAQHQPPGRPGQGRDAGEERSPEEELLGEAVLEDVPAQGGQQPQGAVAAEDDAPHDRQRRRRGPYRQRPEGEATTRQAQSVRPDTQRQEGGQGQDHVGHEVGERGREPDRLAGRQQRAEQPRPERDGAQCDRTRPVEGHPVGAGQDDRQRDHGHLRPGAGSSSAPGPRSAGRRRRGGDPRRRGAPAALPPLPTRRRSTRPRGHGSSNTRAGWPPGTRPLTLPRRSAPRPAPPGPAGRWSPPRATVGGGARSVKELNQRAVPAGPVASPEAEPRQRAPGPLGPAGTKVTSKGGGSRPGRGGREGAPSAKAWAVRLPRRPRGCRPRALRFQPGEAGAGKGRNTAIETRRCIPMASLIPWRRESALAEWDPFRELEEMHERMGRLLDRTFGDWLSTEGWLPMVDVEERDDAWVIEADLPGVERKDVTVELQDNQLTIHGERKERERSGQLRRRTRRTGRFEYRLTLPSGVEGDRVQASMTNGVLTVTVPKSSAAQRKRIEVKSS